MNSCFGGMRLERVLFMGHIFSYNKNRKAIVRIAPIRDFKKEE